LTIEQCGCSEVIELTSRKNGKKNMPDTNSDTEARHDDHDRPMDAAASAAGDVNVTAGAEA
jgi:hypothetical protein